MNKAAVQPIRPLILIFTFVSAFAIIGKDWLLKNGISQDLLIYGNLILFLVTFGAYYINTRSLRSSNPNAPVRGMYAGFMIKFFLIALAAFIYTMVAKKQVNKPGFMNLAGLYIVYTALETKALMQLANAKKNA